MDIDVVSDDSGLAALAEDWARIHALDQHAEFFSGFFSVHGWWASYERSEAFDLRVLVARHNGTVAGILPLAGQTFQRNGHPRRVLRFASHGDWMSATIDPALPADTMCRAFLRHLVDHEKWDVLNLDHLRGESHLAAHLFASPQWNPHLKPRVEHPLIDVRGVHDLQGLDPIPAKTRKYRNRLHRDHDVEFKVLTGNSGEMLQRLSGLHRAEKEYLVASSGRAERHSWSEDPLRMGHYESLFNAPDLVATYCYESRGTLIAARSAFRHRRNLLSWTSCYDPDFRDYRLGKVLQYDILDHILTNDDVDEFDLGAGRYPWKFEWTRHFDTSYRLRVERTDLSQPPAERTSSAAHGPARPAPPTQETHQPAPAEERPRAEVKSAGVVYEVNPSSGVSLRL